MQENKSSNIKQNEKIKDTVVQASKIKVDVKDNSKQASKVETKVQDKKKIGMPLALIATILVIAILGMTAYARFRSRIGGQGTAPVAAWSFKVNGSTASIANFDLGATRNDANGKVADGVIAPGTSGNFDIEIDGSGSQVAIEYSIEIDASNMPTNLKLYRDENHTKKIEDASRKAIIQGYIDLANINTKVKETIYWEWPYRTGETEEEKLANDRIDTQEIEQNMGQTVLLPIKVVGIQSNPNEQDLSQAGIEIVNAKEGEYSAGDVITLQANYSDNIYASSSQEAITSETAPVMTIKFGDGAEKQMTFAEVVQGTASGTQANKETEEGIKLASNEKISLSNIEKGIKLASNNASSIKYTYTVTDEDDGAMQIVSYTGTVYSKKGKAVQVTTKALEGGSNITVSNGPDLKVGDTINYSPSGTYSWDIAYATYTTGTALLNSAPGGSFNITKWKVLSVDENTRKIEMVPEAPTSGTVGLQGARGYNNAVYLLNELCSNLYGDSSKGITARSIKEEDFVTAGGTVWTNYRASYKTDLGNTNYAIYGSGHRYTSKYYPYIYAKEKNSVINGTINTTGYSQSEQTSLIGGNGYGRASSIQLNLTYYDTRYYNKTAELLGDYAGILLPNGSSTSYWVASRCVYLNNNSRYFGVRCIQEGALYDRMMFGADSERYYDGSYAVFPVVSLSSKLLETTATVGIYNVK